MRERLEQRVRELRQEYAAGQKVLADLKRRQATIRETLLRISGAIQVLEEELGSAGLEPSNGHPVFDSLAAAEDHPSFDSR